MAKKKDASKPPVRKAHSLAHIEALRSRRTSTIDRSMTQPSRFTCVNIAVAAVVLLIAMAVSFAYSMGEFRSIKEFNMQGSRILTGIYGAEDFEIVDDIMFISSDYRDFLKLELGKPLEQRIAETTKQGCIYTASLADLKRARDDPTVQGSDVYRPLNTIGFTQPDFHPHGLGVFKAENGSFVIMVVNHRRDGEFVEVFRLDGPDSTDLIFKTSLRHPEFVALNDVSPVNSSSHCRDNHVSLLHIVPRLLVVSIVRDFCLELFC
eukprot:m.47247 g.47247  ORF g.47247 m.47247 type:complete len:264 (+) comp10964_c0_seq4:32-823(+)